MKFGKVKRRLCTAFLAIIIALTCICSMNVSGATDRAGVYTISGTYDIGDGSVSGYIEDFRIAVSTKNFRDDVSVTKFYNNKLFDWTYFSFYLHAGENVKEHTSFTLMRDGSRYNYKNLSGNTDLWLYQGELPDGNYELIYVGVYKSGFFSTKTYTFKYKFEVDTTPPSYTLKAGGSTIAGGSYTNKAIEYNVLDKQTTKIYYMSPSASSYSYISNTVKTISATAANNGLWKFYATDGFQSNNTVSVYLDTVSPVGKITNSSGTTLSSGSYTNKPVKYTATDTGGINFLQVLIPNASSWANYSSGTALSSSQGWYYFRAVDHAGNGSGTSGVYYDATAPTGTLYGGSSVKSSGSYTNASYIKYSASDSHSGVSNCYVKKPGSSSYVSYTNGSQLTAEGTYSFYCVDYSGNQSATVSITLDRTIPTAELFVDGEAVPSGTYTNGEYIFFESDGNCYVKLPNSTSISDYVSGTEYDKPGKYVFYAQDAAGNNTGEYSIVIDRTSKDVWCSNVFDAKTDGDVTVSWKNGDADIYAPITSVTVNGKTVSNGEIVHTVSTGSYEVFVTDAAGNTWFTSFVSTKKNILNDTLQKEYYETTDKSGELFSFETYDNVFAFAAERENSTVSKGVWSSSAWDTGIPMDAKDSVNAVNGEYFIYKKSGAHDELVAYFTLDRLNEVIAEYADDSIKSYYYWQKAPATQADGENLYRESDGGTLTVNSVILGEHIGVLLDGEEFTGSVIETEGTHTVTVYDSFGNSRDYTVTIVRNTPSILYSIGEGAENSISFDRTYYFKDEVRFSISDNIDTFAMFRIVDKSGNIIAIRNAGETYMITESGEYAVISVNHAGDSQPLKLVVSRNAPAVDMTADAEEKRLIITVTPSKDRESHIQSIEILKSTDGGSTWQTLTEDDYCIEVSLKNREYSFRTSGLYKVVITDEFRTGIDAIIVECAYEQKAPTGVLTGVDNNGHTNRAVTFKWYDEATVTVTRNGDVIEYRSGHTLIEDGEYIITIENYDSHKTEYLFVIDTTKPEIKLNGAENESTVTKDITVSFTDKAVIYRNGVEIGEYASTAILSEDGEYRVIASDLAGNQTEVSFTVDKSVDYTIDTYDNGIANSVTANGNEKLTVSVTKNDEPVEYKLGNTITEVGKYHIILTDMYGNKAEISFEIIPSIVSTFTHNFDNVAGFEKVLKDGAEKRLNYGTLELLEDGTHELGIVVNGKTYPLTVKVDAIAPTIDLDGVENGRETNGKVILSNISEQAKVQVYLNDTEIEYQLGAALSNVGDYKVVLTDDCGNVSEYTFEILPYLNVAVIVLIVIGIIAVVGAVVLVILKKKKLF